MKLNAVVTYVNISTSNEASTAARAAAQGIGMLDGQHELHARH